MSAINLGIGFFCQSANMADLYSRVDIAHTLSMNGRINSCIFAMACKHKTARVDRTANF